MTLILPPTGPENATPVAPDSRQRRASLLSRVPQLLGPVTLLLCALLLWDRVEPQLIADVQAALGQVGWGSWAIALPATALSLWAVGHYDGLMHRALGTGIPAARARAAGRRAIAVGQAVGFGTLVGALVRWRCLPQMGAVALGRFSLLVSLSFLAAWAVVTGAVALVVLGGLAGTLLLVGLGLLALRIGLPARLEQAGVTPAMIGRLLLWTTLDTAFAALVLWAFLPGGVPPGALFLAYLAGLGAGLISQSPGGLGAFELTLLWMLPQVDPGAVIAAALCYRLTYQIGPGLLALALLIPAPRPTGGRGLRWHPRPHGLYRAAHPDWGLTGQGAGLLLGPGRSAGWLARAAPGTLVAIGPAQGRPALSALQALARDAGQTALLYKCTRAEAARARAAGWTVLRIAQEAWTNPQTFRLDRPGQRQLRRKLRGAEKAGVTISTTGGLPLAAMAAVNAEWAAEHGGERGFSMGRFCARLLAGQRVALAWEDGRLIAFASFHVTPAGWGLDLMRHRGTTPDGTMHALICAGIGAARAAGATRLSLAASLDLPETGAVGAIPERALQGARRAAAGLRQFKDSFGPQWQPLYAAAPGPLSLARGLTGVTWAIHRPGALHDPLHDTRHDPRHDDPAQPEFAFELAGPACDAPSKGQMRQSPL